MFAYEVAPHANVTTSGTANTEVDHLRILTVASRGASITRLLAQGKGAGLTAISGIMLRLNRYGTPSSAGSSETPNPKHPAAPAAITTAFTGPTVGSTPTAQLAVGCGAAGPGGWVARDSVEKIHLEAGGGADGNVDVLSVSGTTSLNFEYSLGFEEA
jgi:hypothetical protein